jgi:pterin-4a-carbinolamine dehydratase
VRAFSHRVVRARLVHAISEMAGLEDHHPDVDVR